MRHAYLILAHNNFNQLKKLINLLDDIDNDIFIHIDEKSKINLEQLELNTKFSNVKIYSEYKVFWGDFSIVQAEMFLFKKASLIGYDYYHLLSGMDLPIKPISQIKDFFEKNKGREFVHYSLEFSRQKQVKRRAKFYYFFQKYRKTKNHFISYVINLLIKCEIFIQMIFKVNRLRKSKLQVVSGSQWVSITNEFVLFILSNEEMIYKLFKYSNCSDELFIQTLLFNSKFKNKVFVNKNSNIPINLREIIWEDNNSGSPHIWRKEDFEYLINSEALFARKFDCNIDDEIVSLIYDFVTLS